MGQSLWKTEDEVGVKGGEKKKKKSRTWLTKHMGDTSASVCLVTPVS